MKPLLQLSLLLLAVPAFGHTPQRTLFLYFDAANRLTNTTTPLSRVTSQGWNNRGRLQTVIEPSTNTANFYYDARSRLTNRTDGAGTTYYRYDANNNLTTVSEGTQTNTWGFDAYDRVTAFTNADGYVIRYGYDANGNVTGLTYPGNRTVHYAYDSLNRLTNVTDWADRQTSFEYDLASRLKKIIRPNGTVREINYDDAGQTTSIVEKTGGGLPLAYFKLNWNDAARVQWEFAAPFPHTYTPPRRTMTYDDDNRIATFNGNNVTYDADGNLTSGPGTNNTFISYTYDARNRLVGTLSTASVTYGYDPAGNRVGLTNGASVTTFVVNPNAGLSQVFMRIKSGVTNYYVYGLGLLYEVTETASSTTTLTYHYDYRGSTIALTDGSGNVTDRAEYSAYGSLTYRSGTSETPFWFNGRYGVQTDPNGLLHMRARYYNPYLCRFINPDPSGFAGGLNWYAFADGNPISLIDPFGLGAVESGGYSWLMTPSSIGGWAADQLINLGIGTVSMASWALGVGFEMIGAPPGHLYQQADTLNASMSPFGRAGYYDTQNSVNQAAAATVALATMRPTSVARGGMTPLYRAVAPGELADLSANAGAFRNPLGIERKYFSETAEGAASYARQAHQAGGSLYQGPYTIVRTEIPTDLITPILRATPDRGIPTVTVPTELLPRLTPAQQLSATPLPRKP